MKNRWSPFPPIEYGGPYIWASTEKNIINNVALWNLLWLYRWDINESLDWAKFKPVTSILREVKKDSRIELPDGRSVLEAAECEPLDNFINLLSEVEQNLSILRFYTLKDWKKHLNDKLIEYNKYKIGNVEVYNFRNKDFPIDEDIINSLIDDRKAGSVETILSNSNFYLKKLYSRSKNSTSFFPFIDIELFDFLLKSTTPGENEIYLKFSADNFIKNRSTLITVRSLINKDYKVYGVSQLPYMCIIYDDDLVFLGSKNVLTNFECDGFGVIITDKSSINEIMICSDNWKLSSYEITLDMIDDMESLVESYSYKYNEIYNNIVKEEMTIHKKQFKRKNVILLNAIRSTVKSLVQSNRAIPVHVTKIEKFDYEKFDYVSSTHSLVPMARGYNLIEWTVNNEKFNLSKSFRYIFLDLSTGRFAWARVFKTRITFFNKNVRINDPLMIFASKCKVEFRAVWDNHDHNIEIKLYESDKAPITIHANFDLLYLTNIRIIPDDRNHLSTNVLSDLIKENTDLFSDDVAPKLLTPFKYQRNLIGVQANEFFTKKEERMVLRLVELRGHKILISDYV